MPKYKLTGGPNFYIYPARGGAGAARSPVPPSVAPLMMYLVVLSVILR